MSLAHAILLAASICTSACVYTIPDYNAKKKIGIKKIPRKLEVFRGQAHEVCTVSGGSHDIEFGGRAHAHLYLFAIVAGGPEPGDAIRVTIPAINQAVVFDKLDGAAVTIEIPAAPGSHLVLFDWLSADGKLKGHVESWTTVAECPRRE